MITILRHTGNVCTRAGIRLVIGLSTRQPSFGCGTIPIIDEPAIFGGRRLDARTEGLDREADALLVAR